MAVILTPLLFLIEVKSNHLTVFFPEVHFILIISAFLCLPSWVATIKSGGITVVKLLLFSKYCLSQLITKAIGPEVPQTS